MVDWLRDANKFLDKSMINRKSLLQLAPEIQIRPQATLWKAADFITENMTWDQELLRTWLSPELANKVSATPIPFDGTGSDGITWKHTVNGQFSTSTAYQYIRGGLNPLSNFNPQLTTNNNLSCTWIWKLKCLERIKSFLWFIFHNRLFTNFERYCTLT